MGEDLERDTVRGDCRVAVGENSTGGGSVPHDSMGMALFPCVTGEGLTLASGGKGILPLSELPLHQGGQRSTP